MRKESSTVQKCKRQMATLGFDSQLAYHRVKLILKIYRDVVWVLSERVEELHEYAWELGAQDADTGLIYLQSFAPDMDLQEFEERVCCVIENRMLVDVIDRALLRLKRYPDRGELYYEILTKQFIHRFNSAILPSGATLMTCTFTVSPSCSTAAMSCTYSLDTSEMWTMPTRPSGSATNAPNGFTPVTRPSKIFPTSIAKTQYSLLTNVFPAGRKPLGARHQLPVTSTKMRSLAAA